MSPLRGVKVSIPFDRETIQAGIKKSEIEISDFSFLSKWRDSNPRPFGPEPNALPNCATPRKAGADKGTRTPDLLITNQPLYQLSYIGKTSNRYYSIGRRFCPEVFWKKAAGLPQCLRPASSAQISAGFRPIWKSSTSR